MKLSSVDRIYLLYTDVSPARVIERLTVAGEEWMIEDRGRAEWFWGQRPRLLGSWLTGTRAGLLTCSVVFIIWTFAICATGPSDAFLLTRLSVWVAGWYGGIVWLFRRSRVEQNWRKSYAEALWRMTRRLSSSQ